MKKEENRQEKRKKIGENLKEVETTEKKCKKS